MSSPWHSERGSDMKNKVLLLRFSERSGQTEIKCIFIKVYGVVNAAE